MGKWIRENATLMTASAALVALAIFAIGSFCEWMADDPKSLRDGVFALFYLGLGLANLRRWRQQQLRM